MQKKNTASPDETHLFDKEKMEIVNIENFTLARVTLQSGWSWEKCVKPIVKTESCQVPHTFYVYSGQTMESKKNTG